MIAGTSVNPASCEARQRRSPATISKFSPRGRSKRGCSTPFSRMLPASSASGSGSKTCRGW